VYAIFGEEAVNMSKQSGINVEEILDRTLTIFAMLRIILAGIVLGLRGLHNDILTGVLVFLMFTSIQRFYYEYMRSSAPQSKVTQDLDKYQPVNSVLIFVSSVYIMKYVLF
jgi:prolipoprotein diacylglyceryltransferase